MSTILVVDDLKSVRDLFAYDLRRKTGFEVLTASDGHEALNLLADSADIDVVILDLEMPGMNGLLMLEKMSQDGPHDVPVIVYTGTGNFQRCVKAVQLGAYNFFSKDEVTLEQLIQSIENALQQRRLTMEIRVLRRAARQDSPLVGVSEAMEELRNTIQMVAEVPSNVLVLGESGTGKELVAREIHRLSPRCERPFVAVNCAAIPENLVESELFGFEKGAFSGAVRTSKGKFEAADSGTLFLDEIGDMPVQIQAKLLRVLEAGEVTRLGSGGKVIKVDVRVIAATHKDLFFRICTHVVRVPPVRQRLEDIKPLTLHFAERICERFGISQKQIHPNTLSALQEYDWHRNNVRELENIVERMIIRHKGDVLLPDHIPSDIRSSNSLPAVEPGKSFQELRRNAERHILIQTLEAHDWHITKTAKALGISNHSNLLKIMRRLHIQKPES
jgi:DNA-binding NtrC family response regulator